MMSSGIRPIRKEWARRIVAGIALAASAVLSGTDAADGQATPEHASAPVGGARPCDG
jgi:hypothetical protein